MSSLEQSFILERHGHGWTFAGYTEDGDMLMIPSLDVVVEDIDLREDDYRHELQGVGYFERWDLEDTCGPPKEIGL